MELLEISGLVAALRENGFNVLPGKTALNAHYHDVIHKIRDLVFKLVVVGVLCCYDHFGAFLAALLEDLVDTLFKQVAGI